MRRLSGKNLGAIATFSVVVLFALIGGYALAGFGHSTVTAPRGTLAAHAPSSATRSTFAPATVVHPLQPNVTAAVTITAQPPAASAVPESFNFSLSVTNATIDAANVSVTVAAWEVSPLTLVSNFSVAIVTGQTDYTVTVDYAALSAQDFNGNTFPGGAYMFNVWATVSNSTDPNGTVTVVANATTAPSTLWVINDRLAFTSTLALYDALPVTVNFTISVSGNQNIPVNIDNLAVTFEIRFIVSGCGSQFGLGGPCPSVANNTFALTNGTTSYNYTVDDSALLSGGFGAAKKVSQLPTGEWQLIGWITATNTTDPAAEPRTTAAAQNAWLILNPTNATFLYPGPGASVGTGNVTFTVSYTGDFINGANITVKSSTGAIIYTQGVFVGGTGTRAAATATPFVATSTGTYTEILTVTTAYGSNSWSQQFNVSAGAGGSNGVVYRNSSSWSNQSLIPGVSGAAAGTILLVVGLIVGMIVALLLGRMVWGGGKSAPPAQPWSPGSQTAGKNECSVCHQSFPTEQELKDHQKSAHGMT